MNCQEFWDTVAPQGGEINEEQSHHLSECPLCAGHWEGHRVLSAGMRILSEDWRQTQAPDRVETGLTAAFRLQAGYRRPAKQSWLTPVFAWASAAAAMVAIGALLVRGWQPTPARPDHSASPHRVVQTVPVTASAQESDADDDSSILGDGFVRLPNAARLDPNEAYDFATVAFPGSYMIALGLPLSEDRASETVLAKVALGADGTARAVRLVSDGETF